MKGIQMDPNKMLEQFLSEAKELGNQTGKEPVVTGANAQTWALISIALSLNKIANNQS